MIKSFLGGNNPFAAFIKLFARFAGRPFFIIAFEMTFYFLFPVLSVSFLPPTIRPSMSILDQIGSAILGLRLALILIINLVYSRKGNIAMMRLVELSWTTSHGRITSWLIRWKPIRTLTRMVDVAVKLVKDIILTATPIILYLLLKRITLKQAIIVAAAYIFFLVCHLYIAEDRHRLPFTFFGLLNDARIVAALDDVGQPIEKK